jgi:hypothetical protein
MGPIDTRQLDETECFIPKLNNNRGEDKKARTLMGISLKSTASFPNPPYPKNPMACMMGTALGYLGTYCGADVVASSTNT